MFRHFGIHQVQTHAAEMLDHVKDQLQIVQIGQVGNVINYWLPPLCILKTGDLPSFVMGAADQRRSDDSIRQVIACWIRGQCHVCSDVILAAIVNARQNIPLYKFDRIIQLQCLPVAPINLCRDESCKLTLQKSKVNHAALR